MFRRILLPLDGSEEAEKVLPVAIGEARTHGATLVVLRVIPPLRSSFMVAPKFVEQLMQQATGYAREYVAGVAQRLRDEGLEAEVKILAGVPAAVILDFAEESGCDLIVIGSRGESGVMRWRFGGTADRVVKTQTSMPVLVVST